MYATNVQAANHFRREARKEGPDRIPFVYVLHYTYVHITGKGQEVHDTFLSYDGVMAAKQECEANPDRYRNVKVEACTLRA